MSKKDYDAVMRGQNKHLQRQGVRIMPPICNECGEPMIKTVDSITKKISNYLWETNCEHAQNLRISIG